MEKKGTLGQRRRPKGDQIHKKVPKGTRGPNWAQYCWHIVAFSSCLTNSRFCSRHASQSLEVRSRLSFGFQKVNPYLLARLRENCPEYLKTFQTSGYFLGKLENFQTIWKLSRPSGNFPGHLENFQAIWKLS